MAKRLKYPLSRNWQADDYFVEPYGKCDYTGMMFPRSQLVKQMRQAGNNVYWSGLYVYKDFIDPLDDQLRVPPIPQIDPPPVKDPRPNAAWEYGNYTGKPPPPPDE